MRKRAHPKRTSRKKKSEPAPLSAAVAKVVQMVSGPDASAAEVAEVVALEPVFALKVLSMVNSAVYGLRTRMDDVRQAVTMLGLRSIKNLALGLLVSDMAPSTAAGAKLLENSVRRATACRLVGKALAIEPLDGCFTAGLLLDVGLLTLARSNLELAVEITATSSATRVLRELANDLESHAERSATLAREYLLPEATIEAIARHHDEVAPEGRLGQACWMAERLASVFEGGDVNETHRTVLEQAASIGLEAAVVEDILARIPEEVAEMAVAFERQLPEQKTVEELMADANLQLVELNQQYEHIVKDLEHLLKKKTELEEELRQANERLTELASTDALTQLLNRRAIQEVLERDLTVAAREGTPLSLVVLDVDHFKRFNDTWGHATGDQVLRVVGQVLSDGVQGCAVPGRFGGEEFVVVLPNTDAQDACRVAESLRATLENTTVAEGPNDALHVTASFGVATATGPTADPWNLFRQADAALYQAKELGRNRVSCAA